VRPTRGAAIFAAAGAVGLEQLVRARLVALALAVSSARDRHGSDSESGGSPRRSGRGNPMRWQRWVRARAAWGTAKKAAGAPAASLAGSPPSAAITSPCYARGARCQVFRGGGRRRRKAGGGWGGEMGIPKGTKGPRGVGWNCGGARAGKHWRRSQAVVDLADGAFSRAEGERREPRAEFRGGLWERSRGRRGVGWNCGGARAGKHGGGRRRWLIWRTARFREPRTRDESREPNSGGAFGGDHKGVGEWPGIAAAPGPASMAAVAGGG